MPLLISMADDNIFAGNKVLYIIINPLSLTPTAPGRGSADTPVSYTHLDVYQRQSLEIS